MSTQVAIYADPEQPPLICPDRRIEFDGGTAIYLPVEDRAAAAWCRAFASALIAKANQCDADAKQAEADLAAAREDVAEARRQRAALIPAPTPNPKIRQHEEEAP